VIMMSKHGSARYGTSAARHLVVLAVCHSTIAS
jgi:hypothetical protein